MVLRQRVSLLVAPLVPAEKVEVEIVALVQGDSGGGGRTNSTRMAMSIWKT